MKVNRVLFIIPNNTDVLGNVRPSPAVAYLSEFLENHDIETRVLDLTLEKFTNFERVYEKQIAKMIDFFKPNLIGYPIFSFKYRYVYALITYIKKKHPDIPVVVGGPHVSTFKQRVLEECPEIDFGVVLEGEETLLEICRDLDPNQINGLVFRDGGKVCYRKERPFINDLDTVPFPKYKRFDLTQYIKEKTIFSSRGCPYRCSFCPVKTASGRIMRYRSPINVVDEIEYWYLQGIKQFDFQDDNFTLDRKRVVDICDQIEKRHLKNLLLRCSNGIRADKTDLSLLRYMKKVGFRSVGLGVESVSPEVLVEMNKSEKIEIIDEAVNNLCELDYDVHLFFIVGLPKETAKGLENMEAFALKYPILKANFYNPVPYPGTQLHDYLKSKALLLVDSEEYLNDHSNYSDQILFVTPELSSIERQRWLKRFRKLEKNIMKAAFQRKFSYLGPFLSKITSNIFVSDFFQNLLFHNKMVRNIADFVRYKYFGMQKNDI
jgi:anaerobic magnesium-protoporphyrin IX monomethyl ester cyclase